MPEEQDKIVRRLTYIEKAEQEGQAGTPTTYQIGTEAKYVKYTNPNTQQETTIQDYLENFSPEGSGEASFNFSNPKSILTSDQNNRIKESEIKFGETSVNNTNPYKEDFAKLLNDFNQLKNNFDNFTNNISFIGSNEHDPFTITSYYSITITENQVTVNFGKEAQGRKININIFNYTQQKQIILKQDFVIPSSPIKWQIENGLSGSNQNTIDITLISSTSDKYQILEEGKIQHLNLKNGQTSEKFQLRWSTLGGLARNKNIIDTSLLNLFYPIGSLYISTTDTHPTALFGGSWKRIKGRFIFGSYPDEYTTTPLTATSYDKQYQVKETGGSIYLQNHSHAIPHTHEYSDSNTTYSFETGYRDPSNKDYISLRAVNTEGGTETKVTTSISTSTSAPSGIGDSNNMPPYYVAHIWERIG